MSTATANHYSLEEYFALEETSPLRHEFCNGEIFTITGGTSRHNNIALNIAGRLMVAFEDEDNFAFTGEMGVVCPTGLYTYPDVMVVRGKPDLDRHRGVEVVKNPTVIVEVLSPSTEKYDRGKKFEHYRTIPSLHRYLLVAQDKPLIELFIRQPDNQWQPTMVKDLDAKITFPEFDVTLSLAETYNKVDFSES